MDNLALIYLDPLHKQFGGTIVFTLVWGVEKKHDILKREQFCQEIDENGRRYISYTEGLTKTRNKGLNFKPQLISLKMYENKTKIYSVALFLLFKSKRPLELQNMGLFYLTVIDAPLSDVWYKNKVMEVNTINTMNKKSPWTKLCANNKKTNHSARTTTIQKLESSGFSKCEIKNMAGHSSERRLDAYDSGNEDERFAIKCFIIPPRLLFKKMLATIITGTI